MRSSPTLLTAIAIALPTPGAAAGITYDCDTAANHFSELVIPAPSTAFTVTGNLQVNTLAESAEYAPIARLLIASPPPGLGQSPESYAGVSLTALPTNAKRPPDVPPSVQMLGFNSTGGKEEILPLSMLLTKIGSVQPFSLSYDGKMVTVGIGNESRSFALATSAPVVRFVCSTGEFLFTNVVIQPAR